MNVFSYLRVSSASQVGKPGMDKDGEKRQREAIAKYCAAHSLNINAEFFDAGVSGTTEAMERPNFSDMVEKIVLFKSDPNLPPILRVDAIVVENMTRLARDLMVSEYLLKGCRDQGIKVFCADQADLVDVASTDIEPTRKMIRQIMGAVSEWDKSMLVHKLAVARKRIRASGKRCEGKKPYGSRPGELEIQARISSLRELGYSSTEIAIELNASGHRTRHGKQWTKDNVRDIESGRKTKK
jgi:DNA invertase Pin-like site-specific DNA recombinase